MLPFLEALDARPLVCDGAMGTMLYARGVFINRSFDALNLTQPDLVTEIHRDYVRAGADVVETNTFGANRIKLASFGLAEKLHAINAQGARLARHAARDRAYVAGAIGPLGIRIEPWGKTGTDEAEAFFREQATALLEGGVDLFVLETFRDLSEIRAAIAAVRVVCDLPIVAQMTTEQDGDTLDGTPPERFAPELRQFGADVIGVNCSVGPAPMLETIERMAQVTDARLAAQPNAGKPRDIEGRNIYLCSPDYMASYARRFITRGVRLVGGCCGTTPEHIRQIRTAVGGMVPAARSAVTIPAPAPAAVPPVARAEKSRMANALARGSFVTAVELIPPRGYRCETAIEQARALKIHGVDLITIPDGEAAVGRLSALSVAVLIEQQAGIETVLQYSCRDRNILGMQSDLLGAHAMGLRNVLLTTGAPAQVGSYPDATAVFDVDSIGLTNMVSRLNQGLDVGGQSIGQPTGYHIGVLVNPTALDPEQEIRRFAYKVEAGAEFAVTTPIFDVRAFESFLRRVEPLRVPLVASVVPLRGLGHAERTAHETPGALVPDEILARLRAAASPVAAAAEGVEMAREIAAALKPMVQGLQLATVGDRLDPVLEVIGGLN
ncbi:MAG TPA: bifunctional homocysteine S-methyltransferase/methylenetetrahydrofolate reductase [Vicinamibacterales bacterium]|jgi:homocysteine S-methyltransferase